MPGRPIKLRRQSSEKGAWEMAQAPAARRLEGLVRGYTGFVETSAAPLRRTEAPSGSAVLIINFGVPIEVAAAGRAATAHPEGFVARLSELPASTAFRGTSAGVQVDLTPLGLHLFCGLPVDRLPAPTVGLVELLGADGRRLAEALEEAPGWEARFDLLDSAIARRVGAGEGTPTPSIEWAWRQLEASAGSVEIGSLSDRIGCSRRHLIAGFREQVGVAPKTAARILRFDRAARLVRDPDGDSLARVAGDAGYHDQAHMTREFRSLSGITPAAYRAAALPGHLGMPDPAGPESSEVKSVQDAAGVAA